MIRVVLVEDEPHAREKLKEFIGAESDLEVVGECPDGLSALQVIGSKQPELVFLDIQMPGLTGIELMKSLERAHSPCIIVTTAYTDHAVWAFEVNAVDYLLKPYDQARFRRALHRARVALHKAVDEPVAVDAGGYGTAPGAAERRGSDILMLKVGSKIKFVSLGKIRYIRAQGDYILVNTVDEEFTVRERIKNIEDKLDDSGFLRIHRSVLLNSAYISEMKPRLHGDYEFVMRDGAVFRSSASYRNLVRAMAGKA